MHEALVWDSTRRCIKLVGWPIAGVVSERIVILSDTHFGRPHSAAVSAAALRPLWAGASHLIINGDVAEIHHPHHWPTAARQVLHLFDLCDEDGVALTLLSGNHDPFISDLRHLHLCNGDVFVTHGDALHPAIAPWSPNATRLRQAHRQAIRLMDPQDRDELQSRLAAAQHASFTEWENLREQAAQSSLRAMLLRPWALLEVIQYWREYPQLAASFAREHAPHAKFIITGHTHRPGIWTIQDKTIINTGGYGFPGPPAVVVIEDDTLSVLRIGLRNGRYDFAAPVMARFALVHAAPAIARAVA